MFHGGTNFGFGNGALWQNKTLVYTTSYDYGSPLDESGRTTDLYHSFRKTIQKYVPAGSIPEVPAILPMMAISQFALKPAMRPFDTLGPKMTAKWPMTMEAMGQYYGFTLYSHRYTASGSLIGSLQPGDRARDRVLIFVNGNRVGVIDGQYLHPSPVSVALKTGDILQLLVESLGRLDYYSRGTAYASVVQDPFKGISGNVTVGRKVLEGWDMHTIPLCSLPAMSSIASISTTNASTPMFYQKSFNITKTTTDQWSLKPTSPFLRL